jgi:predicted metal-dependent peptidase
VTGDSGGPDSIARRWNQAADVEVNDDLEAAGLTAPGGVISPRGLGLPEGRLAEEYLSLIEVLDTAHRKGGRRLAELIDCGSAADGIEHDYEDSTTGDGLSDTERDILELAIAREIETHSSARMAIPGGWRRWATTRLHPAVDWRAELGAVLRRGVRHATGRVDFSYSRPSRRPVTGGVVMPAMIAPAPEVALVVDTSGSITPAIMNVLLAEVTAIVSRAAGPCRRLRVICCDLQAHPAQTVRRAEDIELFGGGGTDMREGISAALALRPRPDLILVLTDGQTAWPDHRPPAPVVIGLVGPGPGHHADAPPPEWARVVALPAA